MPKSINYEFPKPTDHYDRGAVHHQLIYAMPCPVCGAIVIPSSAERHTAWHNGADAS